MANLTDLYRIDHFNDTFALGHYARVLNAMDRRSGKSAAFKVLRPEHLLADGDMRWEYQAFGNEAEILTRLGDSPHVVQLMDCGFVSTNREAPHDGEIESFQQDVRGFVGEMAAFARRGWRPYLCVENLSRSNNLFYLMKPNQQGVRWRLPSEEGLALAIQFGNVLRLAHSQQIVYLDHKLEHVYWDGAQLKLIDFNSSKQLKNTSNQTQEYINDLHNLCVGVLYSLFTGMSPMKTSLRPQPSSQDQVEKRYEDVTDLDFNMEPSLSEALKKVLQAGAAMQIPNIDVFVEQTQQVAAAHGWDFPHSYTSPTSRDARDQMRAGLRRLRDGQQQIRDARDLFREAVVLDGITEDVEDEFRRLLKSINEMLNKRVIP